MELERSGNRLCGEGVVVGRNENSVSITQDAQKTTGEARLLKRQIDRADSGKTEAQRQEESKPSPQLLL